MPFVWSAGEKVHYDRSAKEDSPAQYEFYSDTDEYLGYGQGLAHSPCEQLVRGLAVRLAVPDSVSGP